MSAATTFLDQHAPLASGDEIWGSPAYPQPLRLTWYRTDEAPPLAYVTSVRAIVFRGDEVLVVREVLEEVAWALGPLTPLGLVHLRNLGPRPPDHPYPYPDVFQMIFVAEAAAYHPEALIFDAWVASSVFMPFAEAQRLPLRAGELALLDAAVVLRAC